MKRISIFLVALLLTAVSFAQVKDYHNIKYPAPKAPQIVKPFQFKLKNGLTVLFMEDHELPIVSGRILFHTGSVADPAGKTGLAALVGDTMRTAGNSRIDGDRMDDYLESIAASVESFAGDTSASISFRCLKENTDKVLDLFQATIETPVFAEKQVDVSTNHFLLQDYDICYNILQSQYQFQHHKPAYYSPYLYFYHSFHQPITLCNRFYTCAYS